MPQTIVKHATSSTYVFGRAPGAALHGPDFHPTAGPDGWRLGLIMHPLFRRPMVPGGHVEADETVGEAALREVAEETGLRVRLVEPPGVPLPPGFPSVQVAQPWWIVEHPVPSDNHLDVAHIHVDNLYVAVAEQAPVSAPDHPFSWYAAGDLADLDLFEDTRILAGMLFAQIDNLAALPASR
ncbi:MAG TPA: NUDIX domain-containing protein [Streptosporangiaceae bacterium]|jgi:8-oxo-dGTP pyrophosphatase MutT (NUDIX family)